MAKDPAERYVDARALKAALVATVATAPTVAPADLPVDRAAPDGDGQPEEAPTEVRPFDDLRNETILEETIRKLPSSTPPMPDLVSASATSGPLQSSGPEERAVSSDRPGRRPVLAAGFVLLLVLFAAVTVSVDTAGRGEGAGSSTATTDPATDASNEPAPGSAEPVAPPVQCWNDALAVDRSSCPLPTGYRGLYYAVPGLHKAVDSGACTVDRGLQTIFCHTDGGFRPQDLGIPVTCERSVYAFELVFSSARMLRRSGYTVRDVRPLKDRGRVVGEKQVFVNNDPAQPFFADFGTPGGLGVSICARSLTEARLLPDRVQFRLGG